MIIHIQLAIFCFTLDIQLLLQLNPCIEGNLHLVSWKNRTHLRVNILLQGDCLPGWLLNSPLKKGWVKTNLLDRIYTPESFFGCLNRILKIYILDLDLVEKGKERRDSFLWKPLKKRIHRWSYSFSPSEHFFSIRFSVYLRLFFFNYVVIEFKYSHFFFLHRAMWFEEIRGKLVEFTLFSIFLSFLAKTCFFFFCLSVAVVLWMVIDNIFWLGFLKEKSWNVLLVWRKKITSSKQICFSRDGREDVFGTKMRI